VYPRNIEALFSNTLNNFRCLALSGPRQTGKSTFLKHWGTQNQGIYITLDDPAIRDEVNRDPVGWLKRSRNPHKPFMIDEAIKCPELFSAVKIIVDEEDPKPTRIILASSGNYLLIKKIKESLAGRVGLLKLLPLSWSEMLKTKPTQSLWERLEKPEKLKKQQSLQKSSIEIRRLRERLLLFGGFPEVQMHHHTEFASQWAQNYFETYILPLALDVFTIQQQAAFQRIFRLTMTYSSKLLNIHALTKSSQITSPTVKSYLEYLEAMMVVFHIPQYFLNSKKRLIKSPKIYTMDSLLLRQALTAPDQIQLLKDLGLMGNLYETWFATEVYKSLSLNHHESTCYTWRTQDGAEVDLVLTRGDTLIPIEVKAKTTITKRDLSGLYSFLDEYKNQVPTAYIAYMGTEIKKLENNIWCVPDYLFLE
jgi:uncharacterized protein